MCVCVCVCVCVYGVCVCVLVGGCVLSLSYLTLESSPVHSLQYGGHSEEGEGKVERPGGGDVQRVLPTVSTVTLNQLIF